MHIQQQFPCWAPWWPQGLFPGAWQLPTQWSVSDLCPSLGFPLPPWEVTGAMNRESILLASSQLGIRCQSLRAEKHVVSVQVRKLWAPCPAARITRGHMTKALVMLPPESQQCWAQGPFSAWLCGEDQRCLELSACQWGAATSRFHLPLWRVFYYQLV